jgi:hypothetical protein
MAHDDNGYDEDDDDPPLSDLADHVASRRTATDQDSIWSDLSQEDINADDFVWEHFSDTIESPRPIPADDDGPERTESVHSIDRELTSSSVPDGVGGLSLHGQILHGYILSIIFLTGAGIYTATSIGMLPRQYWLLSIPLFSLGIILLIPVIAWEIGVWDPRRIG